jgi:hypothetical protein
MPVLTPRHTPGARATPLPSGGWRLEIPAGPAGSYRLAQLDDYANLPRRSFPWQAPYNLSLRARASEASLPGTWGFGLWNDPFTLSLGFGGERRVPALPNTAWFFFASAPNYLSLRDDLPAQGRLAATFQSPRWPTALLAPAALALPLLALPPVARLMRRLGRRVVRQDAAALQADPTEWHTYRLEWGQSSVTFWVDGNLVLETGVAPLGPLGLVIWVDNQYAAWPPSGRLSYGTLENHLQAWIEIDDPIIKED